MGSAIFPKWGIHLTQAPSKSLLEVVFSFHDLTVWQGGSHHGLFYESIE